MKILMLGWEYPPHISGGLGTACEGLSTALARSGVQIHFVVPRLFGDEQAGHMYLTDSLGIEPSRKSKISKDRKKLRRLSDLRRYFVSSFLSPYVNETEYDAMVSALEQRRMGKSFDPAALPTHIASMLSEGQLDGLKPERYGANIFEEVDRFTADVMDLAARLDFDVIHAHDWMTFPAAAAVAKMTGKPFVAHVHSLEYDRSGAHMNGQIHAIEGLGISAADAVVGVSYYTSALIKQQHDTDSRKIYVVHNGVYPREVVQSYRRSQNWPSKVVLFLGRITFQKGPDYFVEAAAKVVPFVPDVMFVMAGAGDMLPRMVDRVHQLGIGKHFQFTGFLRGEEVEEMFSIADLYVMPSVSEPFGISALEAISFDTPVIISKQSGVAEVLSHALKVDFWDVDRLADLIINGLIHSELREDMTAMAREEVKRLRWDASALKTIEIYRRLL